MPWKQKPEESKIWGIIINTTTPRWHWSKLSKPQLNHNSTQPNITLSWVRHENDFAHHPTPHPTTQTLCLQYLSCYWPDFDETLNVGSWEHLEQILSPILNPNIDPNIEPNIDTKIEPNIETNIELQYWTLYWTQYSTQYSTQYWTQYWTHYLIQYWTQYWNPILNPILNLNIEPDNETQYWTQYWT